MKTHTPEILNLFNLQNLRKTAIQQPNRAEHHQSNQNGLATNTSEELAETYVLASYLASAGEFLEEQYWLKCNTIDHKAQNETYGDFLKPLFRNELFCISPLRDNFTQAGSNHLKKIIKSSRRLSYQAMTCAKKLAQVEQKEFLTRCLSQMSELFLNEEKQQSSHCQSEGHVGPRLYRAFDSLDDVFNLNYQLDRDMSFDHGTQERLYQGSGVGVQSGYSTILLALHYLTLRPGDRIIDLGSGYGRVGLVFSLMRPDCHFIGYEYVPHRVEVCNNATKKLELSQSLSFHMQDLSSLDFVIPTAETYYLYDPFSKSTYEYVLKQIVDISKSKSLTIVTKGNARDWLSQIADDNHWPKPQIIDYGNLCLFKTASHH